MKISELIEKLQAFVVRHGNLNATVNGVDIDNENIIYDEDNKKLVISEL